MLPINAEPRMSAVQWVQSLAVMQSKRGAGHDSLIGPTRWYLFRYPDCEVVFTLTADQGSVARQEAEPSLPGDRSLVAANAFPICRNT